MAEYNADLRQDWGAVASLLNWERGLQADKRDQEEQAIRWQGEQDYKTLVDSGVDPMEALQRTAGRLFHNQPREMSSAFEGAAEGMRRKALEGDPITKTMPDGTVFMRTLNGWTQVHIPNPRPPSRYDMVEESKTDPLDANKVTKFWTPKEEFQAAEAARKAAGIQGPIDAKIAAQRALQLEAESQINAGNDGLFGGYKRQLRDARAKLAGLGVEVGDGVTAPAAITPPTAATRPWPNPFGNMLLPSPPVPSMSSQPAATASPAPANAPAVPAKTWPRPGMPAIELLLKNPSLASEFDRKYGPGAARTFLKPFGK